MRATKEFFQKLRYDYSLQIKGRSVIKNNVSQDIVELFVKCKVIDINNPAIIDLINTLGAKYERDICAERYLNEDIVIPVIDDNPSVTKDDFIAELRKRTKQLMNQNAELKERIKQLENQNAELNVALKSESVITREDNANISISIIKEHVLEYSKQFDNKESLKRFLQDINDVLRGTAWDSYYSEVRKEAFAEFKKTTSSTTYNIDRVDTLASNASSVTNNHYKNNNG